MHGKKRVTGKVRGETNAIRCFDVRRLKMEKDQEQYAADAASGAIEGGSGSTCAYSTDRRNEVRSSSSSSRR